jgi:enoyl-CoA hydratase/carnithine racemase
VNNETREDTPDSQAPADILLEIDKHVAVIRLNRPESMNTFTRAMGEQWTEAYRRCDADDQVRVIIVTGNGRAFCAGADMSGGAATFDKQTDMNFSSNPIMPAYKLRKPVIAALNGHAVGLGFSLALQCDFRIAAHEGKYGLLQVTRGVLADGTTHWLLPRLVGMEKALEIMLLGEKMTGPALVEMGLARSSVPADEVLPAAMALAEKLAAGSAPLVAAMAKRLMWQSLDMTIDAMTEKETRWLHHTMGSPDAVEGGMAYFEQRPPVWSGSVSDEWPE